MNPFFIFIICTILSLIIKWLNESSCLILGVNFNSSVVLSDVITFVILFILIYFMNWLILGCTSLSLSRFHSSYSKLVFKSITHKYGNLLCSIYFCAICLKPVVASNALRFFLKPCSSSIITICFSIKFFIIPVSTFK